MRSPFLACQLAGTVHLLMHGGQVRPLKGAHVIALLQSLDVDLIQQVCSIALFNQPIKRVDVVLTQQYASDQCSDVFVSQAPAATGSMDTVIGSTREALNETCHRRRT